MLEKASFILFQAQGLSQYWSAMKASFDQCPFRSTRRAQATVQQESRINCLRKGESEGRRSEEKAPTTYFNESPLSCLAEYCRHKSGEFLPFRRCRDDDFAPLSLPLKKLNIFFVNIASMPMNDLGHRRNELYNMLHSRKFVKLKYILYL